MKNLKCKFCEREYPGDMDYLLWFHVTIAHKTEAKVIRSQLSSIEARLSSLESAANTRSRGYDVQEAYEPTARRGYQVFDLEEEALPN